MKVWVCSCQRVLIPDVQLERSQYSNRMEYSVANGHGLRVQVNIDISGSTNVM